MNRLLALVFAALGGCKFLLAWSGGGAQAGDVLPALFYAAMFGAPQWLWVWLCLRSKVEGRRLHLAVVVAVLFALIGAWLGFLPGTARPSWGGEGHFEVPFGLLLEGGISVAGALAWRWLRPRASDDLRAT